MADITVKIGGEDISVPLIMNFATLQRAWSSIKLLGDATDTVDAVGAAIAIIAASLLPTRPELSGLGIGQRLRVDRNDGIDEMGAIVKGAHELIRASGLVPKGEAMPAENPPAETSTSST